MLGKCVLQLDSIWWPGEKTAAENKQNSQYLPRLMDSCCFPGTGNQQGCPCRRYSPQWHPRGPFMAFLGCIFTEFPKVLSQGCLNTGNAQHCCSSAVHSTAAALQSSVTCRLQQLPAMEPGGNSTSEHPQQPGGAAAQKIFTDPKKSLCTHTTGPQQDPGCTTHALPLSTETVLWILSLLIIRNSGAATHCSLYKSETPLLALHYYWRCG